MPGLVVHTALAAGILERWREHPASAPFDPHDPRVAGVFFRGSMAPDMGYYPGGARIVSDLIHQSGSADMVRALLHQSADEVERAYAWGWVTHLMGDIALHPLINRASREALHGTVGPPISPEENPALHLQVELGLDAHFYGRHHRMLRSIWSKPVSGPSMAPVTVAFHSTYGLSVSRSELERSDLALTRFLPLLLRFTAALSAGVRAAREQAWLRSVPILSSADRPGAERVTPLVQAFASPLPPTPPLLRASIHLFRTFFSSVQRQVETGLEELSNHDLDTGEIISPLPAGLIPSDCRQHAAA